ncbi:hypothetical protein Tco_0348378 [Tanacetum coccineum]
MQQPLPNNNYIPKPSFNQNYMQQLMINPEDISNPTTVMNMALFLMAKAFKLNYSTPTNNIQRISSNLRNKQISQSGKNMGQDRQMQMVRGNGGNQFRQYAEQNVRNHNGYNAIQNVGNQVVLNAVQNLEHGLKELHSQTKERDAAFLQTQLLIAKKEEAGIQLQAKEFDLIAAAGDLDEIEEVNANYILMANLKQASTSVTQTNKAPIYAQMDQLNYTIMKIVMIMIYSICLLKRSSILNYSSPFLNSIKFNRITVMLSLRCLVWNKVRE